MSKTFQIAIAILIFIVGLFLGIFIKDFPIFTWNKEIQLDSVISALTALAAAIVIPYWITKWLDNNKGIKQFLINEIGHLSNDANAVKLRLDEIQKAGTINLSDKKELNFMFDSLDRRLNSTCEMVKKSYPDRCESDISKLKDKNRDFWKAVTQGNFMESKFKTLPLGYMGTAHDAYFNYEAEIKLLSHKINNF